MLPFMPPTPPMIDETALFGNLVAAQLREIESQFVDDVMLQVLQMLNDA